MTIITIVWADTFEWPIVDFVNYFSREKAMIKLTEPQHSPTLFSRLLKYSKHEASANSLYIRNDVQSPKDKICVVSTQIHKREKERKRERARKRLRYNMNHWYFIKILFTVSRTQYHWRTSRRNRTDYMIDASSSVSQLPFHRAARFSIANYYAIEYRSRRFN